MENKEINIKVNMTGHDVELIDEMLIKCRNTLERRIRNDGKNTNRNQRMEAQSKI